MERNRSGLLRAALKDRPKHWEASPQGGIAGITSFNRTGKVIAITTPTDALVRVHETMHALHTNPEIVWNRNQFVHNIIEDCRLHSDHWPWKPASKTPAIICDSADRQLNAELAKVDETIKTLPDMPLDKRGECFGIALRDLIALRQAGVDVGSAQYNGPPWLSKAEKILFAKINSAIIRGQYDMAADMLAKTYFPDPDDEDKPEGNDGDDESEEEEEKETAKEKKAREKRVEKAKEGMKKGKSKEEHKRGKAPEAIVTVDDQGPFVDPCGEPHDAWTLATSGARIHRPSLRRPILPQRLFMRRRPMQPGGTIIIDASGSMGLSTEDIIKIIDAAPMATLALYSGNDSPDRPNGKIYVVAQDGFRRSRDDIYVYVESRQGGNTIDLEAIDWLMKHDYPRTFVTDRQFCGSYNSEIALAKLEAAERIGDLEVIHNNNVKERLIPKV